MRWPDIVELKDVTIAPLNSDNSKRKLRLGADPARPELQHFRSGRHSSAVEIYPLDPSLLPASRVVEEPVIYGGLLFRHFGHSIAESIHRLWPRFASDDLRRAKIAFSLVNNAKIMPYFRQALALHGIPKINVIRIDEPICFRRLFVGSQARHMAGPTLIEGYRSMLDGELAKRLGPAGGERRLYVSRRRHQHTGSFYGESFLEEALAAEGFEIIYPEQHSITEFVTILRSSSIAVFAEGSAIHALELCGSATPMVFVVGRRRGSIPRFTPLLTDVCDKWMVSDRLLRNAGMSANPKKHSGVLDLPAMLNDLWSFAGLRSSRPFTHADVAEAIEADLEFHIRDARYPRSEASESHAEQLRRQVLGRIAMEPPSIDKIIPTSAGRTGRNQPSAGLSRAS